MGDTIRTILRICLKVLSSDVQIITQTVAFYILCNGDAAKIVMIWMNDKQIPMLSADMVR
ncbi:hypothetical protein Plhal304r1_c033g0103991 [Plasmopara halstedii]